MSELGNKRSERNRRTKNRKLIIVILLLLLCVAAAMYILAHFGRAPEEDEPVTENVTVSDEETAAPEGDAEEAASETAAEHVYSHRGSAGDDELSFITYDRAVEEGSKYLEADIVVSASGTIYLARDDHAFDMTGYDGYFSGMADSQIDELTTRSGNKLIKLQQLFDRYGDSVTYIVDLKYSSPRNTDAFTEIVKKNGFSENVIAASSFFDALRPLDEEFPDMKKLYICQEPSTFGLALSKDYIDIISVPKDIMTADNLNEARKQNKLFSVWTLNTENEIREAIDLGVDSYFTDDSGLAIGLEKEYRNE